MTTETKRSTAADILDDLIERNVETAVVVAGTPYSLVGAKRLLPALAPGVLEDLYRQLNEIEERTILDDRRRADTEAAAEADAEAAEQPDPMAEVFAESARAAEERAAFRATDGGRLERLIELQERTVELLEALSKR